MKNVKKLPKIAVVAFGSILIASLILVLPLQPAFAAQFGRPDTTTVSGSWAPSGAATLHEATDEVTPNGDTDFATITDNVASVMTLGISGMADPQTNSGHIMRITCKALNGSDLPENIRFILLEGATVIKTNTLTCNRSSYTTQSFTLTPSQADSITDYTLLRLRALPTALGGSEEIRVTQMELEVPDAPTDLLGQINGKVDQILALVQGIDTTVSGIDTEVSNIEEKLDGSIPSKITDIVNDITSIKEGIYVPFTEELGEVKLCDEPDAGPAFSSGVDIVIDSQNDKPFVLTGLIPVFAGNPPGIAVDDEVFVGRIKIDDSNYADFNSVDITLDDFSNTREVDMMGIDYNFAVTGDPAGPFIPQGFPLQIVAEDVIRFGFNCNAGLIGVGPNPDLVFLERTRAMGWKHIDDTITVSTDFFFTPP